MINRRTSMLLLAFLNIIAGLISSGLAQEEHTNLDAKQIMGSLVTSEYMRKVAIIHGMKTTTYEHKIADGFTLQRTESEPTNNPLGISLVQIKNEDGSWQLRPDMIIRMDFRNLNSSGSKMPDFNMQFTYTMQEEITNGVSYFVITQEYSDRAQAQLLQAVEMLNKNENWSAKDIKDTELVIPAKYVYYIGKDDRMIHGLQTYNRNGQAITEVFYSTISTNALPDSLFQLPSNLKEVVTKSYADFHRILPYVPPDLIAKAKMSGVKPVSKHLFPLIFAISLLLLPLGFLLRSYFIGDRSKGL